MVSTQFKIVTALGMAEMFGVVSFVLGFNVASACATALAGAVSALVVMRAFDGETQPPSKSVPADVFRLGSESRQAWLSELEQQNGRGRKLLYGLSRIFLSGSPCQRIASGGFLAQSVIGRVAIVLFWLGQAMGFDMRLFAIPPFGSPFADGIPMSAEAIAGVRFEHLFLPLVALYAVTFSLFLIALLGDLATILRDWREQWKYLTMPLFCFAFWALLAHRKSSGYSALQVALGGGHLWAYVAIFVFFPLFFLVLSASLPGNRAIR
ncbi:MULTISPECIES: hypothetical protein [unclassified Bradyrhizobium]|uniref:hypothetical protein n=1 Tax=Bradyrhizobium sp. USDA 4541 TaxID=2817704 RepID=UPI0020A474AE|nr:hypothetical protein [Bradyrhizobium sp. USDA 4541]MCP1849268.1 hypothetical protein [Bradyrhizobium sp. USDA 4541]